MPRKNMDTPPRKYTHPPIPLEWRGSVLCIEEDGLDTTVEYYWVTTYDQYLRSVYETMQRHKKDDDSPPYKEGELLELWDRGEMEEEELEYMEKIFPLSIFREDFLKTSQRDDYGSYLLKSEDVYRCLVRGTRSFFWGSCRKMEEDGKLKLAFNEGEFVYVPVEGA